METRNLRKERVGVVKSNKMNKSVTVSIERKEIDRTARGESKEGKKDEKG